jgi:hypothetical protein
MSVEEKFYPCSDQGLAAFIWFVTAGEDTFDHIDFDEKDRPVVVFLDNMKDNPCADLAKLYHSGAMVRDAKEPCNCCHSIAKEIRAAYRAAKK